MIGQTIAGYEVLDEIGTGGMGGVYKARHSRLRRLVALKVLAQEHLADEKRERRFLQEARAAIHPDSRRLRPGAARRHARGP